MLALVRLVTPLLNLASDLLVQFADGGCADPGAPEGLGDVLDPAHRDAGVVHLQHRLLDTGLPAAVSLDDRGLERQAAQLGHLQRHLACLGMQLALVMASPGIDPIGAMFVALRTAELVGLSIKHGVEGLLHSGSDDIAQVLLHELLVDLDDLPQGVGRNGGGASRDRRVYSVRGHGGFWFELSVNPLQANPHKKRETYRTLSLIATISIYQYSLIIFIAPGKPVLQKKEYSHEPLIAPNIYCATTGL